MPSAPRDVDVELGRAWRDHRRHLLDVAFRTLGNLAEAEDAVQEAYARLAQQDTGSLDDIGGWLVVVVSRICFDRLRVQQRRPTIFAPELMAHVAAVGPDPLERATLDDNVRIALHVLLQRLSAAERTSFILHDVFQYSFDAIAEIVGRSPAACRQLASRARRAIAADAGPARVVETVEQRRVSEEFMAACATGDLARLVAVLDPNVDGEGDLGAGRFRIASGRDDIAPQLLVYLGPAADVTLVSIAVGANAGVIGLRDRRVVTLVTLEISGGLVHHVDALVDPLKLAPIAQLLGS